MSVHTERVPLEHYCTITTPDGATFRWDANQPPASRLRNMSFSTKLGEGFSLLTGNLARRIDLDYPDLQLGMEIVVTLADGSVVFEGRLDAMPREVGQTHSINVTFVGHMAHAKDKKFSMVYVDRALDWGPMGRGRKASWLTANEATFDPETVTDPVDSKAGVATVISDGWVSPYKPRVEAWYDAGPGNLIGAVGYSWDRQNGINSADTNWSWQVATSSDANATTASASSNLRAAGPSTLQVFTPTAEYRYGVLLFTYALTPAGADGARYAIHWYKLAVYGNHGLTRHTGDTSEPDGLYLSDIIRHIAETYCPEFNTDGVEDFNYVVQHCAYKDRTFPFDAFLDLNKYALAHLAVWENKTLTFRPYDLTDYDWEIRTDDPGTTFAPVGLTAEDLYNGIVVRYTDLLTGVENVLTPDDNDELRDTSDANPWNQWGRDHWYEDLTLSGGQLEADALQIGRAVLAEKNRPKTAGTLTVQGYIRDRAGNPQPVSKVRAGDVICVTNFNEINRLIVETDVDDEAKVLRVAVDLPFQTLDALFDRQANARQARGL